MSSKQKQRMKSRRDVVHKLNLENEGLSKDNAKRLSVDDLVLKIAKKEGVSKVTIYADLKFIKSNPLFFLSY